MIYSEIKNYLTQVTSIERVQLMDRVNELLEIFADDEYLNIFNTCIGEASAFGDEAVIDALFEVAESLITALLRRRGIVLNETATLSDKVDILSAVNRLLSWEDKTSLLVIVENDAAPVERFSELVALVNGTSIDHVLSLISEFEDALIERFKDDYLLITSMELIPPEDTDRQMADYKKVKALFGNAPTWADQITRLPASIGMPFSLYLRMYLLERAQYFAGEMSDSIMKVLAIELIHICALSEEGLAKSLQTVRAHMSEIMTDINNSTKLDVVFTQLMVEVNRA